ncbi:TraX family protein [Latilactobacillus fuchuensis]|uniref:TraX family protein n=1 Tax=Latilactobacillus fuchuensis TaxID=164393 RepID=UPI000684FD2D|nr:TraX family protein [Latilactobacillus fuchuensis]
MLLALFFYIFREKRTFQIVTLLVFSLISTGFNFTGLFSSNIQWMSAFTAILIALYSGKEGKKMKWFFYYFYPIHIVILYVLSALLA